MLKESLDHPREIIMSTNKGSELNGQGMTVGAIVWLVIMSMVGVESSPHRSMGVAANAIMMGLIGIGMLAPAWVAALIVSLYTRE